MADYPTIELTTNIGSPAPVEVEVIALTPVEVEVTTAPSVEVVVSPVLEIQVSGTSGLADVQLIGTTPIPIVEVLGVNDAPSATEIVIESPPTVTLGLTLPGPKGDKGDKGDAGIDAHYVHDQMIALKTWIVQHNLNKYPSVSVVNSANDVVIGDIKYDTVNQLTLVFAAGFAGKAYLN